MATDVSRLQVTPCTQADAGNPTPQDRVPGTQVVGGGGTAGITVLDGGCEDGDRIVRAQADDVALVYASSAKAAAYGFAKTKLGLGMAGIAEKGGPYPCLADGTPLPEDLRDRARLLEGKGDVKIVFRRDYVLTQGPG